MASEEIRYATEENIRTLIELINAELSKYTTADNVEAALEAYLNSEEFKKAVKDIVGDIPPSTPTDPEEPDDPTQGFPPTYLKYKIDLVLPEEGEEDTIYFILDVKSNDDLLQDEEDDGLQEETSDERQNRYNEYIWLKDEGRYELIGPVPEKTDEDKSMSYKLELVLPEKGEQNTIYIVPKTAEGDNRCDEYIWIEEEERFELIGPTGLSPLSVQKVEELPGIGLGNVLYLVSDEESLDGVYKAYLWVEKTDKEDIPMAIDELPEMPEPDFGHFELIGAIGFDPKFPTEEDIEPFYNFLIKPNLTKEVTIGTPSLEEGELDA